MVINAHDVAVPFFQKVKQRREIWVRIAIALIIMMTTIKEDDFMIPYQRPEIPQSDR